VHFQGRALQVVLLTDGFDGLLEREPERVLALVGPEGLWRNPRTLQRRLNVLGDASRFADDATVVVLEGPPCT
jgi:hypothetical protein